MPHFEALRVPFQPPTSKKPLISRSVDYAGEQHPATNKRTIVVPVAQLPLRDEDAIHKFKVLAGPRWTPDPPKDGGVGPNEADREHGYMKIACEDFPEPAQNLKWASDVIDRLIAEANVSAQAEHVTASQTNYLGRIPRTNSKTFHLILGTWYPKHGRRKTERIVLDKYSTIHPCEISLPSGYQTRRSLLCQSCMSLIRTIYYSAHET